MKKTILGIGISMVILIVIGVFASAENLSGVTDAVENQLEKIPNDGVSEEVAGYVSDFVEKKGISPEEITSVEKVDFENLPKEVNIENVNDANLAIYQVDYEQNNKDNKVFVVTYSVEKLNSQGDLIVAQDKREFLSFGYSGEMTSGFLKTDTDVETSLEKGYVMTRKGSITSISTNLEQVSGNGEIEIIVYRNGEQVGFGNSFANPSGIVKDYDVQSKDIVTFEPGDVISAYAKSNGDVAWKDAITLVEITTTD